MIQSGKARFTSLSLSASVHQSLCSYFPCVARHTKYVVNKRAWHSNNKQPKIKCKIYEYAVDYNSYTDVAVKKQSLERRGDSGIQSTLPLYS